MHIDDPRILCRDNTSPSVTGERNFRPPRPAEGCKRPGRHGDGVDVHRWQVLTVLTDLEDRDLSHALGEFGMGEPLRSPQHGRAAGFPRPNDPLELTDGRLTHRAVDVNVHGERTHGSQEAREREHSMAGYTAAKRLPEVSPFDRAPARNH